MDEQTVWIGKKFVRPRLRPDELLLMYRLVDNQYWLLRRHSHLLWNLGNVSRLRRKLLRTLNRCRTSKLKGKSAKPEQWKALERSIQSILPLKNSRITSYRLLSADRLDELTSRIREKV